MECLGLIIKDIYPGNHGQRKDEGRTITKAIASNNRNLPSLYSLKVHASGKHGKMRAESGAELNENFQILVCVLVVIMSSQSQGSD
jgi:hypothetical protein